MRRRNKSPVTSNMAPLGMGAAIIVWCVVTAAVADAEEQQRTGLVETFDSVDGWRPGRNPDEPDETFAPREMFCEEGRLVVDTPLATLAQIGDDYFARRGIRPHPNPVWLSKRYGEVDVDRYPYLVARMPKSQCYVVLRVNDLETKVLYSTGLQVQDLRDTGLRGRRPVVLQLLIGSNYGRVELDDIRLVSELTAEEKQALIPRGYTIRSQQLECAPYQGLEALYERERAPLAELQRSEAFAAREDSSGGNASGGESSEWALFRDQATAAPIARLTRHPGTDAGTAISANGRWVMLDSSDRPAKRSVCDLRTGRILTLPPGQHAFFPAAGDRTALVEFERDGGQGRIVVKSCELPSLEMKTLINQQVPEAQQGLVEMAFSEDSNRFVVGFRDHDIVYLGDPDAPPGERLRRIQLPYPIKNLWLTDDDRYILFANCYTYQTWFYDYQAETLHLRAQRRGGGHTALGGGMLFGAYGRVGKIVAPFADRMDEPGDAVRLHGNYHDCSVPVDYGVIAPDRRWAFHDGIAGDVDRQIVAFDLHEPGNVIPVFFHNTSSVGYDVKPYVYVSPDSTKLLLHSSDMLGDGEAYMAPFQRPEPPRNVSVRRSAEGLQVEWTPAERSVEAWGYNVYHHTARTAGFTRLNSELILGTSFLHHGADPHSVYLVTAVENSRLESRFSAPAMLPERPRDDAVCVFLEAEEAEAAVPFRRQYDGYAANFGTMRLMPETPDEIEGTLSFPIPAERLHTRGKKEYRLALRCRLRTDIYPESLRQASTVEMAIDGKSAGSATPPQGRDFAWRVAQDAISLASGDHRIRVQTSTPGIEIDRVALYSADADDRWLNAAPGVVGLGDAEPEVAATFVASTEGVVVRADGPYALTLAWPSPKDRDVDHFSVYVSPAAGVVPSNETLVGSTRGAARFRDTGLRPATEVHYLVVGYDSRGREACAFRGSGKSETLSAAHTIRLKASDALLDPALERLKDDGRTLLRVRKDADPKQRTAAMRYSLEVPDSGDYAVWIYNRPHSRNNQVHVVLGRESGTCRLARYMLAGSRVEQMYIGGRELPERRWYPVRATFARRAPVHSSDVFHLEAGPQEIVVSLDVAGQQPRSIDLGDVIVTNDLTWRPDDYDPRAEFVPEK